jgi:hypothetical protein
MNKTHRRTTSQEERAFLERLGARYASPLEVRGAKHGGSVGRLDARIRALGRRRLDWASDLRGQYRLEGSIRAVGPADRRSRDHNTFGVVCHRLCKPRASVHGIYIYPRTLPYSSADAERVSLIITSCAPPSWMLTAEASVRRAVRCNSAIVSAPQLHIVERTFASVVSRLSFSGPA